MKIGIVTNKIHSVGGVQNSTMLLSKIFKERGHKVMIIGEESLPFKPKKDLEQNIGEYFNKLNKKNNYDVVICNGEFGYAVNHPKAINVFRGNYYGYAKSVEHLVYPEITKLRFEKAKMQKTSAEGKYVVTVSKFSTKGLKNSGIKVDKVIRNCIDTNIFFPRDLTISDSTIAIARGMYYEKGFDTILKLAERGVKIKLFSDLKIDSPNVKNKGFVKNGELNLEYNKAQLLLFPSRFEGGSLTTLEAMACGCPVLTRPVGYGDDLKNKIPSFVAESTGQFLAKYVIISNKRKKYSKQALDYFWEYHNPDKFKKEWIDLIEGI